MMTCEICKKSQMNVNTYQLPGILKIDACTSCMRIIDNLEAEMHQEFQIKLKTTIMNLIAEKK